MAYYSSKNVLRLLKSFNTQWENGGFSPPCPGFRRSAFYIAEKWYVKNYTKPVLIEGGHAFGKTTLLKQMLAALLERGVPPGNILYLSFDYPLTRNKSAAEIIEIYRRESCSGSPLFCLLVNIGALFYFKYFDFFLENLNTALKTDFNLLHLALPLGISFFTFQQLAFLIDSYRRDVPKYPLLDYALFVAFFPKILQGPIALHSEMIPQFQETARKSFCYENFSKGLMAVAFGLAKKVLLADTFGKLVDWGYADVGALDTVSALLVMLAYTLQIYFDFSGYCDVASGICSMLNIELPMNFNSPYKALTVYDFWKRWHITLTRFFRTYIYFPLGGSRKGTLRTYFNIFLIFFVSGIWHGANWTFILWGALHGVAMVLNRIFKKQIDQLHPALSWLATFAFINVTWVYFRAASVSEANLFLRQILHLNLAPIQKAAMDVFVLPEFDFIFQLFHTSRPLLLMAAFFAFALFAILGMKNTNERMNRFKPSAPLSLVTAVLLVWSILSFGGISTFLYINF